MITKVQSPPDWSIIPCLAADQILWLPDVGIRMMQQICYDETALYIHQIAKEQHIRAELTDPLSPVCQDSCMEFFFCPDDQSPCYFNFEFNPNGCLYLGWGQDRASSVRLHPSDYRTLFQVRTVRTEDGWELFYRIPQDFIRLFSPHFTLRSGATIRSNCYKCGDKTPQPHYLSWNPCSSCTPDFHQPADFGLMILE